MQLNNKQFLELYDKEIILLSEDIDLKRKSKRLMQLQFIKLAFGEIGQKEIAGKKDNPRIIKYHQYTDLKASEDEVPWCSSFVNYIVNQFRVPGTNKAAAKSWLDWGMRLERPEMGCIAVFWRNNPIGPYGHVGFVVRESYDAITILGGNQNNTVCFKDYPVTRLLDYRGF